jgi:hypothetical protein
MEHNNGRALELPEGIKGRHSTLPIVQVVQNCKSPFQPRHFGKSSLFFAKLQMWIRFVSFKKKK